MTIRHRRDYMPWTDRAACADLGPDDDLWFPPGYGRAGVTIHPAATATCNQCPVADQCLTYALDHPGLAGIWAGTSEQQRRQMRRRTA